MCRWMRVAFPLFIMLLAATALMAQPSGTPPADNPPAAERGDPLYGLSSYITQTLGAFEFDPLRSTDTFNYVGGSGTRYGTTAGGTFFIAPLHGVPAGATISGIELMGCDTNATYSMSASLYSNTISAGVLSETNHGGVTSSSGCGYWGSPGNISPAITVDNFNRTYYVQIHQSTTDSSTRFASVRIYYKLTVSTAPATARFTDVPIGHPFFRYVEALASSGITGGCGTGLFCPDQPVTRGQMAVFLSVALGLHHPM